LFDGTVVVIQHEVERHPLPGEPVSLRLKGSPVSVLPPKLEK
jgi:putative spermidine/putrescine transport system ATP-binding protein